MIRGEFVGDQFSSPIQTVTCTVNCVGVMGKGIALETKVLYPEILSIYRKLLKRSNLYIGQLACVDVHYNRKVLLFPTKKHWKQSSYIEYVEQGLLDLSKRYKEFGITDISMPPLGCGNGGLDWSLVKELIYKYLDPLDLVVDIVEPINWEQTYGG